MLEISRKVEILNMNVLKFGTCGLNENHLNIAFELVKKFVQRNI